MIRGKLRLARCQTCSKPAVVLVGIVIVILTRVLGRLKWEDSHKQIPWDHKALCLYTFISKSLYLRGDYKGLPGHFCGLCSAVKDEGIMGDHDR